MTKSVEKGNLFIYKNSFWRVVLATKHAATIRNVNNNEIIVTSKRFLESLIEGKK